MTPADIDRVFGRSRLRMRTGDHVEVFREASRPGERRRYTKRFLSTSVGDFRPWTEREWRILARLVGHGIGAVPDVVQFDRGAVDRPAMVQTYDAGITVDHWVTLLPLERDGDVPRHVFEDCAHWWALARHALIALDAIHALQLVHLDLKADNICIPHGPPDFDPQVPGQRLALRYEHITLIDFAFSLVSGEPLAIALPIARQTEYDYQSPRLLAALDAGSRGNLAPTRELDWRCDLFSLAAMLRRYLPDPDDALPDSLGWTPERHARARQLVRRLLDVHDAPLPALLPHAALIASTSEVLREADLAASLQRGWTLAPGPALPLAGLSTPITRIAGPVATGVGADPVIITASEMAARAGAARPAAPARSKVWWAAAALLAAVIAVPVLGEAWRSWQQQRERIDVAPARKQATGENREGEGRDASPVGEDVPQPSSVAAAAVNPASAATAAAPAASVDVAQPSTVPAAPSTVATPASSPPSIAGPTAAGERPREDQARPPTRVSSPAAIAAGNASPAPVPSASRQAAAAGTASTAAAPTRKQGARGTGGAHPTEAAPDRRATERAAREKSDASPTSAAPLAGAKSRTGAASPAGSPKASGDAAKNRVASAQPATNERGSGALLPRASTTSAAKPPSAAAAPKPWPHTAMATGNSEMRQPAASVRQPPAPAPVAAPTPVPDAAPIDFATRARELLANQLPRIAQHAERSVLRVLFAAGTDDALHDDEVRQAAAAMRRIPDGALLQIGVAPADAQSLNDAARAALGRRDSVQEAAELQMRAFGANPLDVEIAGNLALLQVRRRPVQADSARQLALHALTLPDAHHPYGRLEDWTTLAIASALTGHERDARQAWLVTIALASSVQRQCRVAADAYAMYGERLRPSIESMLYRLREAGRTESSPFCGWPPFWAVSDSRPAMLR